MKKRINFVDARSSLNWDEYFMLQAMLASYKSKDPNTKVGCVFVDEENHQVSMGYNGAIAGVDESQIPWGNDRSVPLEFQKYGYVMHSEANAISHSPHSLRNTRLYVTHFPCNECAKLVAAQKVKEVVFLCDKYPDSQETRIAKKIFELSYIPYRKLIVTLDTITQMNDYFSLLLEQTLKMESGHHLNRHNSKSSSHQDESDSHEPIYF